jgi:hypothetical protein
MRQKPRDFDPQNFTGTIYAARIFSNVMSPPSLFAAAAFIFGWLDTRSWLGLGLAAVYGVLASLLPVLFVVFLLKRGKISDIHMSNTRERHIPYLIGLAGAGLAYFLVQAIDATPLLASFILVHIIVMVFLTVINFFWLISAHVASATALTVFAGIFLGWVTSYLLVPLIAVTFVVRRFLKRHTLGELIFGLLVGAIAGYFVGTLNGAG